MYCQSAYFSCTFASPIYPLTHLRSSRTPQNQRRIRSLAYTRASSKILPNNFFFPGRLNNLTDNISQSCNTRCSHELLSASADSPESPECCVVDVIQSRVGTFKAARASNDSCRGEWNGVLNCLTKPLAFAVLSLLLGLCPIPGWQSPVLAAAATVESTEIKNEVNSVENNVQGKNHEQSEYTRRLLQKVSIVFRTIEDVRSSKGTLKDVEAAMNEVKSTTRQLLEEVMDELQGLMTKKGYETEGLMKRSEEVEDSLSDTEAERVYTQRKLRTASGGDKDAKKKIKSLEKQIDSRVREFNFLQERLEQIEDQLLRKESITLNVEVRDLLLIRKECELFVKKFIDEMKSKSEESAPKTSVVGLSRLSIKKDLEATQKELLEQLAVRALLEEESEPLSDNDEDADDFGKRIGQAFEDSQRLQKKLEARIRKDMKKYGDEKRFIVNTPLEEVVKGFPEAEMKWMFGNKEVVIPKAISIHLLHGWRKWRDGRKAEFKKELLQNVDRGKQYVKQKQESIILDRDRVMSQTVFNEENNRWEINPVAVPFAVSKKLVEYARIRQDWGAMLITLKGDDKEYYVDVKEYEMLFEDFGGFDGLYLKMLASGTPTYIQLMPIPLAEWNLQELFVFIRKSPYLIFTSLLEMPYVSPVKDRIIEIGQSTNDEILTMIVFPVVDFVLPQSVRALCGMAWPENTDQAVGTPWYLKWQSDVQMRLRSKAKKGKDKKQSLWMLVRFIVYGYVLFYAFGFARKSFRRLVRFLGFRDVIQGPSTRKLRKVRAYSRFFLWNYIRKMRRNRKDKKVDPIKKIFENMKRIRKPSIRLSDFTNVESIREEIYEVVQFLRNPYVFQKLGARAPRGVLIVGDNGTGKRSLALAIAAEAKVPVVTVKPGELESATWVGQSAANIRELFKTARELAPVIIFVEDFDRFAGVRGKFIHTQQQDHEAFINQLLVELDGFEKQDGVVLMATTTKVEQVDPALKRPGRMDRIFYLEPPSLAERENILRTAAKDTMDPEFVDFVDWSKVADKTALACPTDLHLVPLALEGSAFRNKFLDSEELLCYCSWIALFSRFVPTWMRRIPPLRQISCLLVNHLGLGLTKDDVQDAVDLMEPYGQLSGGGMELLTPSANWTREAKFPHAVWASGRGLMAFLLPNFDVVDHIWLEPSSWEGIGCTKITKSDGVVYGEVETISYLEKKLVFCFGSHIASQMLLPVGEGNNLSTAEIKQAQQIATKMVLHYGWGPDESPVIYSHQDLSAVLSLGKQHQFEMAARVEKIYNLAYDRAKEMLQKNRRVLEKIVDELLMYGAVSGKDMARIHAENGGVTEKEPFYLLRVYEAKPLSVEYLDGGSSSATALSYTT